MSPAIAMNGHRCRAVCTGGILLLLLAAGSTAAPVPAPPGTTIVLPGGGHGSEDDPYLLDLDALIRQGLVATVADSDTTIVPVAVTDTVTVTAAPIRVSEVVRRIGEHMRDDRLAMAGATWTELLESEAVDHPGDPKREHRREEAVMFRVTVAADGTEHRVRLWYREREYRGDRLVSETADSNLAPRYPWTERTVSATLDAPFSLLTANRYRYRILERILIGDHLIYRIGFVPRSRFRPGLRGEVWIDYGEYAIRRMEGSITGVSPAPLLVKEVPRFRMRQQRVGGHWLPLDFSAEVVMRSLPLLPDRFRFRMTYRDYVLPGEGGTGKEVRP